VGTSKDEFRRRTANHLTYYSQGKNDHDGVLIFEAPDDETATTLLYT